MRVQKGHHGERGATLVEAAFTLPLLITLIGGICDFGRAYHKYQVITDAAREAARFAVTPSLNGTANLCGASTLGSRPTSAEIVCFAEKMAGPAGVTVHDSDVTVTQNDVLTINSMNVSYTTVKIQVPVNYIFFPFSQNTKVTAVARMRNEDN